jgi:hypothetical protein
MRLLTFNVGSASFKVEAYEVTAPLPDLAAPYAPMSQHGTEGPGGAPPCARALGLRRRRRAPFCAIARRGLGTFSVALLDQLFALGVDIGS